MRGDKIAMAYKKMDSKHPFIKRASILVGVYTNRLVDKLAQLKNEVVVLLQVYGVKIPLTRYGKLSKRVVILEKQVSDLKSYIKNHERIFKSISKVNSRG